MFSTLTERQFEVLSLLKQGLSNRQVADLLHVTEGTVKIHVAAIFRVMGVANRTEAVLAALRDDGAHEQPSTGSQPFA